MSEPAEVTIPASAVRTLVEQGGRVVLAYDLDQGEWVAGVEFGREAPDSDMVAGAAYGVGQTAQQALDQMAEDLR